MTIDLVRRIAHRLFGKVGGEGVGGKGGMEGAKSRGRHPELRGFPRNHESAKCWPRYLAALERGVSIVHILSRGQQSEIFCCHAQLGEASVIQHLRLRLAA